MPATKQAESFRLAVIGALARRPQGERSITWLAGKIGFRRETVSRAINRGEFPNVQAEVGKTLKLDL